MSRAPKKAASCCADSLKDTVHKKIKQINKEVKKSKSELIYSLVNSAQYAFYSVADDDVIDAAYLYDDDDIQKAVDELIEFIFTDCMIYSLPKKSKMVSSKKATVKVKMTLKDTSEIEKTSFSDNIKYYLENVVIDKLVDNSNFIKEQIAKKIMKESLISCLNNLKNKYAKTTDEIPVRTDTYHLKKKKGSWVITKMDKGNLNSEYY